MPEVQAKAQKVLQILKVPLQCTDMHVRNNADTTETLLLKSCRCYVVCNLARQLPDDCVRVTAHIFCRPACNTVEFSTHVWFKGHKCAQQAALCSQQSPLGLAKCVPL